MDFDNTPQDQSADGPAPVLIAVDSGHVDQLVAISRDLAGFLIILDAASTVAPTYAAVARSLTPINDQLQEFRRWFHQAWQAAAAKTGEK